MGSFSPEPPKPWVETPLIFSPPVSRAAGCNIFLKLENTQPSGSFKSRGIGNMMLTASSTTLPDEQLHFYCSSGGNAGLACATTAITLNRPATIVVPTSTSEFMVTKLRELGVEVIQTGASWARGRRLPARVPPHPRRTACARVYVPPLRPPGHLGRRRHPRRRDRPGLLALSAAASSGRGGLDAVRLGGGGGGRTTRVLAMETVGAESLYASVQAGEMVTLPGITSIATSLGARRVSEKTWEWFQKVGPEGMVCSTVTDKEAALACVRFLDDARILIEVACGATIATAYNGELRRQLGKGLTDEEWASRNVVLVVCGGSHTSAEILAKYKATYGME
ncbi:hypothetical protein CHGG_07221 [Chaetomium globosum CBS 148.51]|uniref:L-serine ammonia-lyase n=1 Tax=Chaetomium globosum (strain ATCC 6205 / CBS 148.51 / DSM 1962 / NBRC 6347 / NRRL 1970) TaxID=306901 RepID=Q2GXT3_CHAGB|nr:uncharacterized protein CHGG_07221 [Chaetomium globosum CBS 148.51]EAQ85968.1 hypothetical protein CHGG_07221 [Chaetomium globosum CBS 148.51]